MAKIKEMTELQRAIMEATARGLNIQDTATECGCSVSMVKQTRIRPEFQAYYTEACYNTIKGLVPMAVKELQRLVTDSSVADNVKATAIKQVLELSRISDLAGAVKQDINITVSYE